MKKIYEIRFSGVVPVVADDSDDALEQFGYWQTQTGHLQVDEDPTPRVRWVKRETPLSYDMPPFPKPKMISQILEEE